MNQSLLMNHSPRGGNEKIKITQASSREGFLELRDQEVPESGKYERTRKTERGISRSVAKS